MANYKSRKAKPRTTSRRHSTSGKILSPLDVRSKNSLGEFKKRIKAGPITIIMVYADWCGHCHTMMPHFDAASASKERSVQSIKLNETMMADANSVINRSINNKAKPLSVEGYPSVIMVDNKGNVVAEPNPPKNTEVLTNLMNKSGNLAVQAGLSNPTMNEVQNRMSIRNNNAMNIVNNTVENQLPNVNSMNSYKGEDVGSIVPMTNVVEPGTMEGDLESISNLSNNNKKASTIRGGSLYASLAQSAYTLAPTAALLASAAYMMNNKRTKRAKRAKRSTHRKNKKTPKRH
jgi:thiol-disulfide isomerase/thioredoxin